MTRAQDLKRLDKLNAQYWKVAGELMALRDKLYPVGTQGKMRFTGCNVTVVGGSLYPDQLRTTMGHISFHSFQRKYEVTTTH